MKTIYRVSLYQELDFKARETFLFECLPDLDELLLFLLDFISKSFFYKAEFLQLIRYKKEFHSLSGVGQIEMEVWVDPLEKEKKPWRCLIRASISEVSFTPLERKETYLTNKNSEVRSLAKNLSQKADRDEG